MAVVITASNVLCAGGRGTEQLWSTVRAGITCIKNSSLLDSNQKPIRMGLVPEDALPPLPPKLESAPLPSSARRMLRLAGQTLAGVAGAAGPGPLNLYLGLPEIDAANSPWIAKFLQYLGGAASVQIDTEGSRIFPKGRAAALLALEAAVLRMSADPTVTLVVGGVDTHLDLRRIAVLDGETRILGARVMDGFIPGEGAAFLVLKNSDASPANGPAMTVKILGASSAEDAGHRYGTAPARGEGLANAIDKLRRTVASGSKPVTTTFAGFNGENFEAKLWGVARLRHHDFFAPDMKMRHPADTIGDTGAAAGAILTALAGRAALQDERDRTALVWAASDSESRGCAALST